jgi:hypothetical protein
MPFAAYLLALLASVVVFSPIFIIGLYVRYSRVQKKLNELIEENAKQHATLQRAIGQLQSRLATAHEPSTVAHEARQQVPIPRSFPVVPTPPVPAVPPPKPAPPVSLSAETKPPAAPPVPTTPAATPPTQIAEQRPPSVPEPKPIVPTPAPPLAPPTAPAPPVTTPLPPEAKPATAETKPHAPEPPRLDPKPATPAAPPKITPPAPVPPAPTPRVPRPPATAAADIPHQAAARISTPTPAARLRVPAGPTLKERFLKAIAWLEDALGARWFVKLGGIMTVIGITFIGLAKLQSLGAGGKAFVSYFVAFLLLIGGIFLEKRESYQLLGRVGIGCGWAALFGTTFGIHHFDAMRILDSLFLDSVLMLGVAAGMAWHTLRYKSQFVTGLAFLLGYTTIALSFSEMHSAAATTSQATAYGLFAGLILAIGLVVTVRKMGWYELEIFGILSSYLNHLYWLYNLLGIEGAHGRAFPEYRISLAILFFYWLTFRISYVFRAIKSDFEEHVSTVAALLNTLLLLGLLRFQSVQPDLAWIALLAIGVLEFAFGQLPITRQRRRAFVLLSVLGAALMLSAAPSKYSGNPVAILWLIGAEVFLTAGIISKEVLFRRLGLLTGLLVGVDLLGFRFKPLVELRARSEELSLATGVLFALCGVVFYLNSLAVRSRWKELFEDALDRRVLDIHSYLGAFASASAIWALFSNDWTAIGFAAAMLVLAGICRRVAAFHLQVQYALLGALALYRAVAFNLHIESPAHAHISTRLITLPILAAVFYLTAKLAALRDDQEQQTLRGLFAMAGTGLLALLIWFEAPDLWQPVAYIALAVALSECARALRYKPLAVHSHPAALLAVFTAFTVDEFNVHTWRTIPWHAIAALPVVAGCYWLAKRLGTGDEGHLRIARVAYTWTAAGVMVWILEEALHAPWIAVGWIAFAVALAVSTRWIRYRQLAWQANVVAVAAFVRTYFYNLDLEQPFWRGVSYRLFTVSLVILGAYILAKIASDALEDFKPIVRNAYTWPAAFFVGVLIWFEAPVNWIAVFFLAAGIILALVGRRWNIPHLGFQEHLFAMAAVVRTFDFNYHVEGHYGHFSIRLITVSLVAAGLYAISRKATLAGAPYAKAMAYLHTTAATSLLALLMWYEVTIPGWLAAFWAIFAFVLTLIDRRFKLDDLRWQAHGLAALTLIRSVGVNLYDQDTWHGLSVRLLSLSIVAVIFYAMARVIRMPEEWRARDFHHIYSWSASLLVALLLWYEMQPRPLGIAVGMGAFGLVLFEYGLLRGVIQFQYQSYVALVAAFARIFYANLKVGEQGEFWGPRLYTVFPLVLILFFVYAQLPQQAKQEAAATPRRRIRFDVLMAYLGTATLVALFFFQFPLEWVVTAYAALALALFAAAWALDRPIFLHQAILVTLGTFARGMAHNLFGSRYFGEGTWQGRYLVVGLASAILLASLYFAFAIRGRYAPPAGASRWKKIATFLIARPEQLQFIVPVILVSTMFALKMESVWVTASWGIEGLCVVLLAYLVREHSFRLVGYAMFVICVLKIVAMDFWRETYFEKGISVVVVGGVLLIVGLLHARLREIFEQP